MQNLFFFEIWPLEPTSSGIRWHLKPLSSMSFLRFWYLSVFLALAASKLVSKQMVSSIRKITFSFRLTNTRSGLCCVGSMSSGTVNLQEFRGLQASCRWEIEPGMIEQSCAARWICLGSRLQSRSSECVPRYHCFDTADIWIHFSFPISSSCLEMEGCWSHCVEQRRGSP